MKIAITGANGFVGAALCRYFNKAGHEIMAIGNHDKPNPNLYKVARYIQADICSVIPEIEADVCIHAAALTSDVDTYKNLILSNVEGTLNVVEAAKNCRFFIHISSSSVYQFKKDPVTEDDANINSELSDYGETRLLAEDIIGMNIPEHQKRLILRPRAIYGIGDRILLPRLLSLIKGKFLLCPFKRSIQGSLTHIDNIGYAIDLYLAQNDHAQIKIFNITDEKPYFLKEVALQCLSAVEKKRLLPLEIPASFLKIFGMINSKTKLVKNMSAPVLNSFNQNAVLDISKIKHELKYKPSKDFQNSFSDIADWINSFGSSQAYMKQLADAPWAVKM
ncbi:MAG: NAD-dependent epimerase/dehydratase family protein [Daejeonella sp.]